MSRRKKPNAKHLATGRFPTKRRRPRSGVLARNKDAQAEKEAELEAKTQARLKELAKKKAEKWTWPEVPVPAEDEVEVPEGDAAEE